MDDIAARAQAVLDNLQTIGALKLFNFRFKVGTLKEHPIAIIISRHVECVEDDQMRDFRLAVPIDETHPKAKTDFRGYIELLVRDLMARGLIHEVDEGLRRKSGEPVVDPHPGGDFGILGNYVHWPLQGHGGLERLMERLGPVLPNEPLSDEAMRELFEALYGSMPDDD